MQEGSSTFVPTSRTPETRKGSSGHTHTPAVRVISGCFQSLRRTSPTTSSCTPVTLVRAVMLYGVSSVLVPKRAEEPRSLDCCPGLQRSSVGANAGALSASPGRTQGSGGARGRSREQEGPPGAGAQAGRCPDLQARGPGCDKARPALKGRTEAEASGSTGNGTQQDRRACPDRHLPSACPGSPRGRPGAGWPLQSDPKLEI